MDKTKNSDTLGGLFDLEEDLLGLEYFLNSNANNSEQNPVSPVVSNTNSNQNPVDPVSPVVSNNNSNPDPLTRFKEILAALKVEKDQAKLTALRLEHDQIFQRLFIKNPKQNHATTTFPNWNSNNNNNNNNNAHQKPKKYVLKKVIKKKK